MVEESDLERARLRLYLLPRCHDDAGLMVFPAVPGCRFSHSNLSQVLRLWRRPIRQGTSQPRPTFVFNHSHGKARQRPADIRRTMIANPST
jgi:hypothetical protein